MEENAETAILLLGSNLGDRMGNLEAARRLLGQRVGIVERSSTVYESAPWGEVEGEKGRPAGTFLNMALAVETSLGPEEILAEVKAIEAEMGRTPHQMQRTPGGGRLYCSRIIDIDIIYYGERVVDLPQLTVPHPLIAEREFVLRPLAELIPGFAHPVTGLTARQMLEELKL